MVGDIKNSTDAGWSIWGHDNGRCVVEFVVDCNTWYTPDWSAGAHENPGQGNGKLDQVLHGKKVVRYMRRGNYLRGDRLGGSGIAAYASKSGKLTDFSDVRGFILTSFRSIWNTLCVAFENLIYDMSDTVVLYDLNDKDDDSKSSSKSIADLKTRNGVVQYYQDDYPDVQYGSGTLPSTGCGPTAVAMVVSTLTGEQITPADVIAWCGDTYYVWGAGSSFALYPAAAEHWGLQCQETGDINTVVEALGQGKVVISSQGPRNIYIFWTPYSTSRGR